MSQLAGRVWRKKGERCRVKPGMTAGENQRMGVIPALEPESRAFTYTLASTHAGVVRIGNQRGAKPQGRLAGLPHITREDRS